LVKELEKEIEAEEKEREDMEAKHVSGEISLNRFRKWKKMKDNEELEKDETYYTNAYKP
jgi:hypothetical protein